MFYNFKDGIDLAPTKRVKRFIQSFSNSLVIAILVIQSMVAGTPIVRADETSGATDPLTKLVEPLYRYSRREMTNEARHKLRKELLERRRLILQDPELNEEKRKAGEEFKQLNEGKISVTSLTKGPVNLASHTGQTYLLLTLVGAVENERMIRQANWDSGKSPKRDRSEEFGQLWKFLTQDGALVSGMGGAFAFNVSFTPVTMALNHYYLQFLNQKLFQSMIGSGVGTIITFTGWEIGRELWTEAKMMLPDEDYKAAQGDYYTFGSYVREFLTAKGLYGTPFGAGRAEDKHRKLILKKIGENMAFIMFHDSARRELFLYNVFRHNIANGDFVTLCAVMAATGVVGGMIGKDVGAGVGTFVTSRVGVPIVGRILGWFLGGLAGLIVGLTVGATGFFVWQRLPKEMKEDITFGIKQWAFLNTHMALDNDRLRFVEMLNKSEWFTKDYFSSIIGPNPDYRKTFKLRSGQNSNLDEINQIVLSIKDFCDGWLIAKKRTTQIINSENEIEEIETTENVSPMDQVDEWIAQEYSYLARPQDKQYDKKPPVYPSPVLQQKIRMLAHKMYTLESTKHFFSDRALLRNHMMYNFPRLYQDNIREEPKYSGREKVVRDEILATGKVSKYQLNEWVNHEFERKFYPKVDNQFRNQGSPPAYTPPPYPTPQIGAKVREIVDLAMESVFLDQFFNRRQEAREFMIDSMVEYVKYNFQVQQMNINRAKTLRKYVDEYIEGTAITKEQVDGWLGIEFRKRYYEGWTKVLSKNYEEEASQIKYPRQELAERIPIIAELTVRSMKNAEGFNQMLEYMLQYFKKEESMYAALIRKIDLVATTIDLNKKTNPRMNPNWGVIPIQDIERTKHDLRKELNHFSGMKNFYIALFMGLFPDHPGLKNALDFEIYEDDFTKLGVLKSQAQVVHEVGAFAPSEEEQMLNDLQDEEEQPIVEQTTSDGDEEKTGLAALFSRADYKISDVMKIGYKDKSVEVIYQLYYESVKEDRIVHYTDDFGE